MNSYRLWIVGCVVSWFLLGLHVPALHDVVGHGHSPRASVVVGTTGLLIAGIACLWQLLRARPSRT